jgi:uncharacterized phiE125 gp8 family phage protein
MTIVTPLVIEAVAIAEVRDWLRLETTVEDGLIEGLVHAAMLLGEAYIGQLLVARPVTERIPAAPQWQRLRHRPVQSVGSVATVSAAGVVSALGSDDYGVDIDPAGDGWVRRAAGSADGYRLEVGYVAGLATGWATIPEPLKQGVIRLAAHGYTHRDDGNDDGPPAAVTALWRPWRRIGVR